MAGFLAGCKGHEKQAAPVKQVQTLDSVAHAYLRLAVALGEHDGDSIDYYYGPPAWVADIRKQAPPLNQIRQSSLELIEALQTMTVHDTTSVTRQKFLLGQLQAIACRASQAAGARSTFDEESMCSFGHTSPKTMDEKALSATREKIAQLIGGHGTMAERYSAFEAKYVIPRAKLQSVMERAIAGCRSQTVKHVPLPADESIELTFAGDEPWAGYSLYKGAHHSVVTINTDFPVTIDRALDLACHEAYPGHHTFNMLQDDAVARQGAPELMVQPTYSPQSFLSESAATIAGEMAFPRDERIRFEREELFPLAGLPAVDVERYLEVEELVEQLHSAIAVIAREYVDGQLEFARAGEALEKEALMGNTFDTLKYLNEFRSYVVTYTCGPDVLKTYLPDAKTPNSEGRRWEMYVHWMRTEPTPGSTIH